MSNLEGAAGDLILIGNPERERAVHLLNAAFTDGYLDVHEFDRRSQAVYAATNRGELRAVLVHLPAADGLFGRDDAGALIPGAGDLGAPGGLSETVDISWTTVTRKGSWTVPARLLVTGSMGTAHLDLRSASLAHRDPVIEVQVSWSTVKLHLPRTFACDVQQLEASRWSSVKDKAGPTSGPEAATVHLRGSLTGSTVVVRRSSS